MALFPVDDDKVFEAALSFVEEFELSETLQEHALRSVSESLPVDRANAASARARKPRKAPLSADEKQRRRAEANERKRLLRKAGVYGDPNRKRKERAREIALLREQLAKLQLDLDTLQSGKAVPETNGTSLVLVRATTRGENMWEELAVRQRQRREASERDNVRLKLAIDRQRKVADSLRTMLLRRTSQLVDECSPLVATPWAEPHVVHVLDYRGDVGEFESLFRSVDTAYRELDAVFESNGLARMKVSPNDVHMRGEVSGKYLEFFTHKVLPFGVQDTKEATWDHLRGVQKHMSYSSLYEKTAKDLAEPYTIVEDFTKEVYSDNARADVRVKQVVRRFVEAERDVIIWVSHAVPAEIRHKMLRGLAYHSIHYAITKRSSDSTPERELSELQLCSLICFDQNTTMACDADTLRALTNFLIVHAGQNIRSHRELIENSLIDRSLRRVQ